MIQRQTIFLPCLLLLFLLIGSCKTEPQVDSEKVVFKVKDNTVRFRILIGPRNLNPSFLTSGYENMILHYMFQYPMDFDEKTLEMAPQLVKSAPTVEHLEGGKQAFTYEILEAAKWDDGKPITGHDYAFAMKSLFNPLVPSANIRAFLEHVEDVKVNEDNPKIFTVITKRTYILAEPTVSNIYVFPEHIYDPNGLMKNYKLTDLTNPEIANKLATTEAALKEYAEQITSPKYTREIITGSGPYKFVEWVDKQKIVMAKKKDWWAAPLSAGNRLLEAHPDTIVFLFIRDDNAVASGLKDENIDVAMTIGTKVFDDLREEPLVNNKYNFLTPIGYNFAYTGFNMKNPILSDVKVRRALAHLTNMDEIVNTIYSGYGKRVVGPFPQDAPYFNKDLKLIPYDVEKAKSLLKEAGWEDKDQDGILDKEIDGVLTPLRLNYAHSNIKFSIDYANLWIQNAKKAGVEIISNSGDFNKFRAEDLPARNFDMFSLLGTSDPLAVLDPYAFWHTDSDTPNGQNRFGFGNAQSDKLIEDIRVTLDDEKRYAMMRELQQIIYDEQPCIFLFSRKERIAVHKRFGGDAVSFRQGIHVNHLILNENQD